MRGLTVILAEPDPGRLRAALALTSSVAALGGRARLFLHEEAVSLLAAPLMSPADSQHTAAGLPTLAQLFEEALAMPVEVIVCQSGLSLAGIDANRLDPRVATGGLVGVMATAEDDRVALA
jgi:predicted peroxiredoxin